MGYNSPERFEKPLRASSSYHMEVDLAKDDCNREAPHWHLCQNGRRIGQIFTYGSWASTPDVSASIRNEAEELTRTWRDEIESAYNHTREHGAGY